MSVLYELWDHETGNCIGAYDDAPAALRDVKRTLKLHGEGAVASLALITAPEDTAGELLASGSQLAALARASSKKEPALP